MKIETIKIENVGGISSLILREINPQINIICGENGVGKTNLLDSIASCFSEFDKNVISKKSGSEKGTIEVTAIKSSPSERLKFNVEINEFEPRERDSFIQNNSYSQNKEH
ncbi:AAA family ATPase, partial [Pantoea agglomerans]|uniref:AAA family ATPase n=1 Tax=Enterobacter agglomerans TaxID=549 RepID=UPI0012AE0F8D